MSNPPDNGPIGPIVGLALFKAEEPGVDARPREISGVKAKGGEKPREFMKGKSSSMTGQKS